MWWLLSLCGCILVLCIYCCDVDGFTDDGEASTHSFRGRGYVVVYIDPSANF